MLVKEAMTVSEFFNISCDDETPLLILIQEPDKELYAATLENHGIYTKEEILEMIPRENLEWSLDYAVEMSANDAKGYVLWIRRPEGDACA